MPNYEMPATVLASNWLPPLLMIFSFPLLLLVLVLCLHIVVDFTPRSLRAHRVNIHPFKTRMVDLWLVVRLLASEFMAAGVVRSVTSELRAAGDWVGWRGKRAQS